MIRLKELRLKKNMTRKEVAEKLDIKPRTYLSYENNEREPNSEMLIVFANFFDVTIDYLIGRTDTPTETYTGRIGQEDEIKVVADSAISIPPLVLDDAPTTTLHIPTLRSDEERLLDNYNKLNITGKDKAQEYTKDLTENDKYTAPPELKTKLNA